MHKIMMAALLASTLVTTRAWAAPAWLTGKHTAQRMELLKSRSVTARMAAQALYKRAAALEETLIYAHDDAPYKAVTKAADLATVLAGHSGRALNHVFSAEDAFFKGGHLKRATTMIHGVEAKLPALEAAVIEAERQPAYLSLKRGMLSSQLSKLQAKDLGPTSRQTASDLGHALGAIEAKLAQHSRQSPSLSALELDSTRASLLEVEARLAALGDKFR